MAPAPGSVSAARDRWIKEGGNNGVDAVDSEPAQAEPAPQLPPIQPIQVHFPAPPPAPAFPPPPTMPAYSPQAGAFDPLAPLRQFFAPQQPPAPAPPDPAVLCTCAVITSVPESAWGQVQRHGPQCGYLLRVRPPRREDPVVSF